MTFNVGALAAVSKCGNPYDPGAHRWIQVSSLVKFVPDSSKIIELDPGTHVWAFELLLPERLQTHTVVYAYKDCEVKVAAEIHLKGSAIPDSLFVPITIVPVFEKLNPVLPRYIDQSVPVSPSVGTVHWQLSRILFMDKKNSRSAYRSTRRYFQVFGSSLVCGNFCAAPRKEKGMKIKTLIHFDEVC